MLRYHLLRESRMRGDILRFAEQPTTSLVQALATVEVGEGRKPPYPGREGAEGFPVCS